MGAPLISDRLAYLDPTRGPFYEHADVALFLARRGREMVGTIAAFVDHYRSEHLGQREGGFGFFEVIEDYAVAEGLLNAVRDWLCARDIPTLRGPTNFGDFDCPGVLIEGMDCPPVMLEAHTPPYYKDFLGNYSGVSYVNRHIWSVIAQNAVSSYIYPSRICRVCAFQPISAIYGGHQGDA